MVRCSNDDMATCCGKCNQKVVACIPVLGRLPLLKHTIERLYKKNGVYKVICAGHLPDDRKLCESVGAEWVQHPNRTLAMKWNASFRAAKKYNPDAVLFVGSSDWVSDNWIQEMMPYLEKYDIIGTSGCHFMHLSDENLICFWPGYSNQRAGESIGIGRLIRRQMLDQMHWEPFNSQLDRSLDYSMMQKCSKLSGKSHLVSNQNIKSVSISTDKWINKHKFSDHYSNKYPSEKIENVSQWIDDNFPEAKEVFQSQLTTQL